MRRDPRLSRRALAGQPDAHAIEKTVITTYGRDFAVASTLFSPRRVPGEGRPPDADLGALPGGLARRCRARERHRCARRGLMRRHGSRAKSPRHAAACMPPMRAASIPARVVERCSTRSRRAAIPASSSRSPTARAARKARAEARPVRSGGQAAVGHSLRRQGQHRRRRTADHRRLPRFRLHARARSAPAVERLLAAGAMLIGKTNLDQFATGLVGVRTPYPVPRNAFDPTIVPGGSSSGSAVAVAAGWSASRSAPTRRARAACRRASTTSSASSQRRGRCRPGRGAGLPHARLRLGVRADRGRRLARVYEVMPARTRRIPFSRPIALGARSGPCRRAAHRRPAAEPLKFFGDARRERPGDAAVKRAEGARRHASSRSTWRRSSRRRAALRGPLGGRALRRHLAPSSSGARRGASRDAAHRRQGDAPSPPPTPSPAIYRLAELRRAAEPVWRGIDALAVPTAPCAPTLAEVEADPLGPNARLGTYTNFVNLLDLAAVAVPGPFRADGRAAGVTLIGPRGQRCRAGEPRAARSTRRAGTTIGATGRPLPPPQPLPPTAPAGMCELAVVGAHLSGHGPEPRAPRAGGIFLRAVDTEASYKLFALPGGPPGGRAWCASRRARPRHRHRGMGATRRRLRPLRRRHPGAARHRHAAARRRHRAQGLPVRGRRPSAAPAHLRFGGWRACTVASTSAPPRTLAQEAGLQRACMSAHGGEPVTAIIPAEPAAVPIDWARTALVIIDMQRDFLEPGGFGEALGNDVSRLAAGAVEPCRSVLAAARLRRPLRRPHPGRPRT